MPDHWMTFATFNEQRYFIYPRPETYRGVVLNANMVAHAPAGVAAFLMGKTATRRYLVDPQTHAFQHEVSAILNQRGNVRESVAALAQEYGSPLVDSLHRLEPLKAKHLDKDSERRELVSRVLRFQREFLPDWMSQAEENDYLQLRREDLCPYALLAPYFYLTESNFERWFPVNVALAHDSIQEAENHRSKIFIPLVISKDILDNPDLQDRIHRGLCLDSSGGFVVWVDGFNEAHESGSRLRSYLGFLKNVRKNTNQEVISLHGGYFSVLAGGNAGGGVLTGVAHGPEFGEHRSVVPVGGGIPKAKFYVPKLHVRLAYAEAQAHFRRRGWLDNESAYLKNVCACKCCQTLLKEKGVAGFTDFGDATVKLVAREGGYVRMEFPTTIAKQTCLSHFLCRKELEFQYAEEASARDVVAELQAGYDQFRDYGEDLAEHLDRWCRALTGQALSQE